MPALRPLATLLACAALAAGLAACGGEDDEGQVRDVLDRFAAATAQKDYQELCDDLLSPELVEQVRSVNLPCEVALRTGLEDVRRPTLRVRRIEISGKTARATVLSGAANQRPSEDEIRLVKQGDEWRIASLATPSR